MATMPLIRVLIATTRGPVEVQNIARENPAVRSVICVGGAFTALPVSPAYDAFVREPTGVVERMTGHPVYRTDVAAPIEAGESWQLGMFLAHAFQLSGVLAKPGDAAGKTILVTGGLGRDLKVTPVTHVAEKLARADAPDQGEGVFLYPHGSEAIADTDGWQSLPVANVRDALKICLGREAAERFLLQQPPSVGKKIASWRSRLRAPVLAGAFISILFFSAFAGFVLRLSSTDNKTQSSGGNAVGLISLSIAARDPVSGECGDLVAIPPDRNVFKGPVCFGRMSVAERGEHRMRMTIDGAFSSYVDQSRYRRELQRMTGGGGRLVLQIDFPYWVREPVSLIAETELLGMDGNPVHSERRALEVMPGGGAGY
ncbi:hypothetical protein [Nisaea denitrificans]|uniref:hypothetical protein n=1 Tax=Nisaea denitrificans TaxID=390877 RepID=UPI0004905D5F|nr:hypothetical protein [Nisaea denitrificans]